MKRRKTSTFERQLKALVKLNKTKSGRALVREHRAVLLSALAEGAAKDARRP